MFTTFSIARNGQKVEVSAVEKMFFDSGESGQRRGRAPPPAFDPGRGSRKPAAQNQYYGLEPGFAPDMELYRTDGGLRKPLLPT